jgi:hypothetical protein
VERLSGGGIPDGAESLPHHFISFQANAIRETHFWAMSQVDRNSLLMQRAHHSSLGIRETKCTFLTLLIVSTILNSFHESSLIAAGICANLERLLQSMPVQAGGSKPFYD